MNAGDCPALPHIQTTPDAVGGCLCLRIGGRHQLICLQTPALLPYSYSQLKSFVNCFSRSGCSE